MTFLTNAIYFDTETLALNPYNKDNKIILAQFGYVINDELNIITFNEWYSNEDLLLNEIFGFFRKLKKYTPVVTYNGEFDLRYIIGRLRYNNVTEKDYYNVDEIIRNFKHCDMTQYNNGYFINMDTICNHYKIESDCKYMGHDVPNLYNEKRYSDIIAHGIDDIKRLYRLTTETNLADRFHKIDYGYVLWKK